MSERKCKECGHELPPDPTPIPKTGVVKWLHADRTKAAVTIDGQLVRVWFHDCPTLREVAVSEGDRVDLMVRMNKYGDFDVVRIALPAEADADANADADAEADAEAGT